MDENNELFTGDEIDINCVSNYVLLLLDNISSGFSIAKINQSINQPINQSINRSIDQLIKQSTNPSINQ